MTQDSIPGKLSLENLKAKIAADEIDTILAVFPDCYGRLVGKRIPAAFYLDSVAKQGMHACNYLLTVDMEMDVIEGYRYASWEKGYGDFHCVPDHNSLRQITWLEKSAMVICDLESEPDHQPVTVAPRTMLIKQLEKLQKLGFTAMGATELEYYMFRETYDSAKQKNFENLQTFGWYIEDYHMLQGTKEEFLNADIRRHMENSGIPIESSKGEWGPGQHEINVRYADVLEMADRHAIYKQGAKEIAMARDTAITFMSKWRSDLAGSSSHMHLSLWDAEGKTNRFPGDRPLGPVKVSDTFRWFLGGWMKYARDITAFYAPYPTSYKRYTYQSWAPTNIACSYDNRTSGFRVVGNGASLRIESRIPGADINPYLAFAATLAAGIKGIEDEIEPPELFEGDVYEAADLPKIPYSLVEAIGELERSEMLRAAFGDEVIEHYLHFFRTEQAKFDQVVTGWERERYFERA